MFPPGFGKAVGEERWVWRTPLGSLAELSLQGKQNKKSHTHISE